tara:strand:- start:94 stop:711 length:618 start_codon:yes stop_codon:yes gene_type:complete
MKLITEMYDDFQILTEGKGKDMKIQGVFMQAETKNRNGRVYPLDVLQKEVTRYSKELVEKKRAFGELGHPEGPTVNLDRVSHLIEELVPEGNNIIGKAKILDTPNGKIVKELLNAGAKLGVSSRGMGTLEKRGQTNYVKNDFYLATAGDIVADPSAPQAFVEGIMEGKEWVWDNGIIKEAEVAKMHRVASANKQAEAFEMFLSKL